MASTEMLSADSPPSRRHIDRLLHLRAKQRQSRACYPCRHRKVKCDTEHPCNTCRKRGHPELCIYERKEPQSADQIRTGRGTETGADHGISSSGAVSPPKDLPASDTPRCNRKDGEYSGGNPVISMLRQHHADESIAQEASSVLGLHNTFDVYPFFDAESDEERWAALVAILPTKDDLTKFFKFYRHFAFPFNPIVTDIEQLELDMCTYLSDYALGYLTNPAQISPRWSSKKSIGQISLLLATLSSGAHYSDLNDEERLPTWQNFANRSFQALRLANFLFQPSSDTIQSLLILGNTLQNNGQSDAAWALLGTTVRLAQTISLHMEKRWPEESRPKVRDLWSMVMWQDSLLSLCHGRDPMVSSKGCSLSIELLSQPDKSLTFAEMMKYLVDLGLDINVFPERDLQYSIDLLVRLEDIRHRCQPHLVNRESCRTLHHHHEYLALSIHVSFCVMLLCRPAIRQPSSPCQDDFRLGVLREKAKQGIIDTSQAFIDFHSLSTTALRTWSMVHAALNSTLLSCIWPETRNDADFRILQQRMIDVFSATSRISTGAWLSKHHVRALVALRNAVYGTSNSAEEQQASGTCTAAPRARTADIYPSGVNFGYDDGLFGDLIDLSPIQYLDSIMNDPSFAFPQEQWSF